MSSSNHGLGAVLPGVALLIAVLMLGGCGGGNRSIASTSPAALRHPARRGPVEARWNRLEVAAWPAIPPRWLSWDGSISRAIQSVAQRGPGDPLVLPHRGPG